MSDAKAKEATKVLIVDDEEVIRDSFGMTLDRAGYAVLTAESGKDALNVLAKEPDVACVVSDIRMPEMDGLELLSRLKDDRPTLPVIIISAHGTPEDAARAIKMGALDYFSKPFAAMEIEARISRAVAHHNLAEEAATLREVVKEQSTSNLREFVTADGGAMAKLRETLDRVAAAADATVLIQGESGTGKEVVARYLHANSSRADKPFLAVNCAALSAGLLESELFGHEKGAFTGADRQRRGRFELARGGTLLLDEVSEISVELQAKLLRVLQERNFERVGSSDSITADVRVLATTNRDLLKSVAEGKFREDLYFRLNVLPVVVPGLRERKGDVPPLAEHFVAKHARSLGRKTPTLDADAMATLQAWHWPGNVRELENMLERIMVLESADAFDGETIRRYIGGGGGALNAAPAKSSAGAGFAMPSGEESVPSIADMEEKLILWAMQRMSADKNQVADALGITTKTLRAKLKKYGAE